MTTATRPSRVGASFQRSEAGAETGADSAIVLRSAGGLRTLTHGGLGQ